MLRYALKRCAYSILIVIGVLLLTFALFRVAAGDPAATVLGKNPTPEELELMRISLGSDKPLLYGHWRKTELFAEADFSGARENAPGIQLSGEYQPRPEGLLLKKNGRAEFQKNFPFSGERIRVEIFADQVFLLNGTAISPIAGRAFAVLERPIPERLLLEPQKGKLLTVKRIAFYRPSGHPFDSQLADAFREIISFTPTFPYIRIFNFGETLLTREPIREVLIRGMSASLLLMLPIFFGELLTGIILAMFSAVFRGRFLDRFIMLLSVAGMSISYLALIIFSQWLFGYYLNWFPVWGWDDPRHLALPVLVGILSGTGSGVRFYRTVFLNEMNREYLRTAAAKGCSPFMVYFKHLLKNAAIPILTRASTVLPFLFTGSLLLESFFGIPGLGFKGVDALNSSDLQTLKALVILGAFLFIFINLVTDLLYAWADPRVRIR